MSDRPFFSVIVPVYNVEMYLEKCLDSVIDQTFTEYELILVDDGSTDGSGKICDRYSSSDYRVKVFHKSNSGQSDSRNLAVQNACGEYLIFLDSDDYFLENDFFERCAKELLESHSPIVFLNSFVSTELSEPIVHEENDFFCDSGIVFLKKFLTNRYSNVCVAPPYWIMKKEFFVENNLFLPSGLIHEDEELFLKLMKLIADMNEIPVYSKPFYFYRLKREGSTTFEIKRKNLEDTITIMDKAIVMARESSGILKKFYNTRLAQFETSFIFDKIRHRAIMKYPELFEKIISRRGLLLKSSLLKHKILFFLSWIKCPGV